MDVPITSYRHHKRKSAKALGFLLIGGINKVMFLLSNWRERKTFAAFSIKRYNYGSSL
jgi:hypothetical protein